MIFGVPYFFRGIFLGEDHEYIYLASNACKVYETGPFDRLYKTGKGSNEETVSVPGTLRIRKGAIEAISALPCKSRSGSKR
jgi:hypothetical protein